MLCISTNLRGRIPRIHRSHILGSPAHPERHLTTLRRSWWPRDDWCSKISYSIKPFDNSSPEWHNGILILLIQWEYLHHHGRKHVMFIGTTSAGLSDRKWLHLVRRYWPYSAHPHTRTFLTTPQSFQGTTAYTWNIWKKTIENVVIREFDLTVGFNTAEPAMSSSHEPWPFNL